MFDLFDGTYLYPKQCGLRKRIFMICVVDEGTREFSAQEILTVKVKYEDTWLGNWTQVGRFDDRVLIACLITTALGSRCRSLETAPVSPEKASNNPL